MGVPASNDEKALKALYDGYFAEAKPLGETLKASFHSDQFQTTEKDLIPFTYAG